VAPAPLERRRAPRDGRGWSCSCAAPPSC
jgi:hypothetical protein